MDSGFCAAKIEIKKMPRYCFFCSIGVYLYLTLTNGYYRSGALCTLHFHQLLKLLLVGFGLIVGKYAIVDRFQL